MEPLTNCIEKFIKKKQKLQADNKIISTKKFLLICHIPHNSFDVPIICTDSTLMPIDLSWDATDDLDLEFSSMEEALESKETSVSKTNVKMSS